MSTLLGDMTPEQWSLVELIDRITERFDRQYWQSCRDVEQFPHDLWGALADAGVLGLAVPEEFGGSGLGLVEMALVQERMAHHGVPLLLLVVGPGLSFMPIVHHGSAAQIRRYVTPAVRGERILCFAVTEPNAGSNTLGIETTATPAVGGYRLSGQKTFISGARHAHDMLVLCRTARRQEKAHDHLTLVMVDLHDVGVAIHPQAMDVAAVDGQCNVFFDDVFVPDAAVIGDPGKGFDYVFEGLNAERVNAAAMAVGLGRYMVHRGVDYACQRRVFDDVPIGAYQGLQHPLAEAFTHLELAWLMTQKAAAAYDSGDAVGAFANMAKLAAVDAALEAADMAIEVHGGNGFTRDYDLMSVWSLCRLLKTAPVTRELILNYIAAHVLGLPSSN